MLVVSRLSPTILLATGAVSAKISFVTLPAPFQRRDDRDFYPSQKSSTPKDAQTLQFILFGFRRSKGGGQGDVSLSLTTETNTENGPFGGDGFCIAPAPMFLLCVPFPARLLPPFRRHESFRLDIPCATYEHWHTNLCTNVRGIHMSSTDHSTFVE